MKIIINYDFFDKVLDARKDLNIFKVIRNNKKKYIAFYFPLFVIVNTLTNKDIKSSFLSLPIGCLTIAYLDLIEQKMKKRDEYKDDALYKLKRLVSMFQLLGIQTDYDLLLKSELYGKVNNLYLNENKLPEIMTSKYILVPSYNYNNDIKNTSILQEHVIGTKDYVLSIGSLKKQYKFVYSNV